MVSEDRLSLVYRGTPPDLICCEPMVRPMADGSWLCLWLGGGAVEPCPDNRVVGCRSFDRGRTWSGAGKGSGSTTQRPMVVLSAAPRALLITELLLCADGAVSAMLASHTGHFEDWQTHRADSRDGGYTWDELQPIPHLPTNTFVRNAWVLSTGETLLPYQHYPEGYQDHRAHNGALISRDGGKTFDISEPTPSRLRGWAEPNGVELPDGSLAMLVRADGTGVLYRTDSTDGGRTWSEHYPTDIPNPGNKIRILKHTDGRIILLHTPNGNQPHSFWNRNYMSMWISDDDMATWGYRRQLVHFPGAHSYPDGWLDEDEGMVHFAFDYNRHDVIYVGAKLPE